MVVLANVKTPADYPRRCTQLQLNVYLRIVRDHDLVADLSGRFLKLDRPHVAAFLKYLDDKVPRRQIREAKLVGMTGIYDRCWAPVSRPQRGEL